MSNEAPKLEQALADILAQRMDRTMARLLLGNAAAGEETRAAPTQSFLDFDTLLRLHGQIANLRARVRRLSLTVGVDRAHEGPALISDHPTDGKTIECSYLQARQINAQIPLRLISVDSVDRALFEPRGDRADLGYGLIPPPYDLPEQS